MPEAQLGVVFEGACDRKYAKMELEMAPITPAKVVVLVNIQYNISKGY